MKGKFLRGLVDKAWYGVRRYEQQEMGIFRHTAQRK